MRAAMVVALARAVLVRAVLVRAVLVCASLVPVATSALLAQAPARIHAGRFTAEAFPGDTAFARKLLESAAGNDSFPGLPRPVAHVTIALAPDDARFREWAGVGFPEWGSAAAFPAVQRIVMHGRRATGEAGNPLTVLRHELAHLALGEYLGDLPPRWFDEGYASYAAEEWGREEVLAANFALIFRGSATFAALDSEFTGGTTRATAAYALAYRAIAELAGLDRERGMTLFFAHWRTNRSLDGAVRQAYGMTLAGFEERWSKRTRRRYGGIALVADLALIAGMLSLFVVPVYVSRRRRERKRLETLRIREELQQERARVSALDALLVPGVERGVEKDGRSLLDTPRDDL